VFAWKKQVRTPADSQTATKHADTQQQRQQPPTPTLPCRCSAEEAADVDRQLNAIVAERGTRRVGIEQALDADIGRNDYEQS
jgi:hypothetical protein